MTFKNLESLQAFLRKDSNTMSINPVRFISVDSLEMWVEVKKLLLSMADESMPLSKFCEGKDTTPNIRRLTAALKKTDHSVFVTPLSEYLRIKPETAEDTIKKIIKADYQNNDNGRLRIYFLMYRIKSVLRTIPTDDPRTKDCIVYLETSDESDYKLTIVQKDLNVTLPGNAIFGFKSYLEYWEANPDKPLILHTENAIHFEKNHFFDDVRVIVSSYDLIKEQYHVPSEIVEDLGTAEQWNELATYIVQDGNFIEACCSVLAINKYSVVLFERWNHYSEFQKWVLWIWTRLQSAEKYHVICALRSRSYEEFVSILYTEIAAYASSALYDKVYAERKTILKSMHGVPTENFWKVVNSLDNQSALLCMTDLTDIERKAIFEIISTVPYSERHTALKTLKVVYPQLYYYLENDEHPNAAGLSTTHANYFSEYKWLKATDTISASFMEKVKTFAAQKGASVFALPTRNSFVTQYYDDATTILFVDGMGIEYVDYLAHLFDELDEKHFQCSYDAGYCTLPSVTEINKDFMNGRNTAEPPIRDLDELKHSNNVHPESLIKQFGHLDSIKDRVLGLLNGNISKVIIAADHGTSRLAVKIRNTEYDNALPKPDGVSVYKYGRFCDDTVDETLYPTAISISDRLIFADYSRFIQPGAPIDEIHGGASLEEWIVPVIVIEKLGKKKKVTKVEITPKATKYKPELVTKLVRVQFAISGEKRDKVYATVRGQKILCEYKDGCYNFVFTAESSDNKLLIKVVDGGIIGQFEIEIEQGIKKNLKFDI